MGSTPRHPKQLRLLFLPPPSLRLQIISFRPVPQRCCIGQQSNTSTLHLSSSEQTEMKSWTYLISSSSTFCHFVSYFFFQSNQLLSFQVIPKIQPVTFRRTHNNDCCKANMTIFLICHMCSQALVHLWLPFTYLGLGHSMFNSAFQRSFPQQHLSWLCLVKLLGKSIVMVKRNNCIVLCLYSNFSAFALASKIKLISCKMQIRPPPKQKSLDLPRNFCGQSTWEESACIKSNQF